MSNALASWGPVDPELLQLRLESMRDPRERAQALAIVNATFACITRIHNLDFTALERDRASGPTRALWTAVEQAMATVWHAVEEVQHVAKPLIDEHQVRLGEGEDVVLGDDILGEATPKKPRTAASATMTQIQRIGETLWATSFVVQSEIDGFRKRLPALLNVPDAWELLSDLQDHVGHIKAALQAILTGIFASVEPLQSAIASTSHDDQSVDLVSSRELRQRIFELRDSVLGVEASLATVPAAEWKGLLGQVVAALDSFMFGPGFAWMRAGDKRTFITQHRGLREILEIWSPLRATPARRAVQNLARYLEALEVINQRECLVLHDRAALETVVARLFEANRNEGATRRAHIAAALAALADAQGRDRGLDQLLEATLAPGSPVPADEILMRAQALLTRLRR